MMTFLAECGFCRSKELRYRWQQCAGGARRVRSICAKCGHFCGYVPPELVFLYRIEPSQETPFLFPDP